MQYGENGGRQGAQPPNYVVCLRVPLNLVTVDNFRIVTDFCDSS